MEYSTKRISVELIEEVKAALQSVSYGSIEIFVNDSNVTQITTRTIKKTSITIKPKVRKAPSKKVDPKSHRKQSPVALASFSR